MNKIQIFTLKALRKLYAKAFNSKPQPYDRGITDANEASDVIYDLLASGMPCMVARYGSTELFALTNYLGVAANGHSVSKYIRGKQFAWWWEDNVKDQMTRWSGFFPSTEDNLMRFGEMMLEDSKEVDVLGSWQDEESCMLPYMPKGVRRVHLRLLEPFWSERPWTRILEGKKVLVVHPFADTILSQYRDSRTRIFESEETLPEFKSLCVVHAVQSIGGVPCGFDGWFDALSHMKAEVERADFDIALIGCGAYGFPLAAHVKRMGRQGVHLGGALQLLFGIRGNRWEDPNYGVREWGIPYGSYSRLMNDSWVKPLEKDKPASANNVEGACYW